MNTGPFQIITYIVTIIIASSLVLILFTPLGKADADNETNLVPQWVKHDALWWFQGGISDADFINSMRWLVENQILPVTDLVEETDSQTVPDSVKKIAYSWSQGNLPDSEFLRGIEYLIKNGMMELNDNTVSKITKERLDQVSVLNDTKNSVVIIPVFTAAAYSEHKFYAYYGGQCDSSCLTSIIDSHIPLGYTSSGKAVNTLQSLGYHTLTDIEVDKNPKILSQYDKVIVLHNEYVTQNEFDAITTHSHVIYLYPNSLYAKIYANYDKNTITLVRGHNYPDLKIRNGFAWKFDNSQLEYNTLCRNWKFDKIKNGIMLNCYPENIIVNNIALLKAIKDY
ncbi:MAG: hypothetical protein KGH87_04815 [Thaumarchaeota archaeon]|nr:hypothetical protein [Nitrososphaerota archaeon]